MTWADYALLGVLAVSMGIGLWRGFVVEVLSLTVWIAAFWLTMGFGADVSARLAGIESPSARLFVGHAAVFLGVLVLGGLLTWLIGKLIANTGLSSTDRLLGLGFGLARGLVLACVAVLLLGFTPLPQEDWWTQSRLIPGAQRGAEWMVTFLPPEAADHVRFDLPQGLPVDLIDPLSPPAADGDAVLPEAPPAPADPVSET